LEDHLMLARARSFLSSAGLSLVAISFSLLQPALAQEPSEPSNPAPGKNAGMPAPKPIPPAGALRETPLVPRQHGGLAVKETSAEGGSKSRVCIAPGDIQVAEFLRFLGDSRGLPVIPAGISSKQLQACISIVTPIEDATPEMVRAILAVNGWEVKEEELAEGSKFLRVARSGAHPPPPAPGDPRSGSVAEGRTEAPVPGRSLVFQVDGATLRPVDARESPLGAQGVEGDEVVTVVTELQWLDSQQTAGTLSNVLPAVSAGDSLRMGPVQGTRRLVLTGKAHIVDRALKILRALDVKEQVAPEIKEPESILQVFKLRHAEPEDVAAILAAVLRLDSPPAIRSTAGRGGPPVPRSAPVPSRTTAVYGGFETLIVSDSRTRSLIVRTSKEKDLQCIRSLLETLDAPEAKPEPEPAKGAAPDSKPEVTTRILQLKHVKAAGIAPLVEKFVVGPDENRRLDAVITTDEKTNSLVVQAGREAWDEILRLILVLDAAPSEDAKK
jgi:type II secretory pathway component GspD/PulD (secretin)